jgi:6-phosphogluconolactonase
MNETHRLQGLRGRVLVHATADQATQRLEQDLTDWLRKRIELAGEVHLALSGGKGPQGLYRLLATDKAYTPEHWRRTHIWMVDERCVPDPHPSLNFAMIRDLLIQAVPVPANQVHPMPVLVPDGDQRYEADLKEALAQTGGGRLDAAVMGMGPDGHTASLFPYTPVLDETQRWVKFNDGPTVMLPRPRMTLTYPVLRATRFLSVQISGSEKHAALLAAAHAPDDFHSYPISGLQPGPDSQLTWYLDTSVAEG